MKHKNLIISILIAAGISLAANVHAAVLQYLTITITTYSQNNTNDNGINAVTAIPKPQTHNTAQFLSLLAQDKAAQGNWPSNSFPVGAKLATGDGNIVVVAGTNILVDVSDIMSFSNGANEIFSGKTSDSTGLANPIVAKLQIGPLTFDDTAITGGGGISFYLQGLVSQTETDTVPMNNVFTRTRSAKLSNGTGEGTDSQSRQFVLTGTISATGRGKETFAQ